MLFQEQKHGILLFDEIILCESIAVKSSNLGYVGFKHFGNGIHASNIKANHGPWFGINVSKLVYQFMPTCSCFHIYLHSKRCIHCNTLTQLY